MSSTATSAPAEPVFVQIQDLALFNARPSRVPCICVARVDREPRRRAGQNKRPMWGRAWLCRVALCAGCRLRASSTAVPECDQPEFRPKKGVRGSELDDLPFSWRLSPLRMPLGSGSSARTSWADDDIHNDRNDRHADGADVGHCAGAGAPQRPRGAHGRHRRVRSAQRGCYPSQSKQMCSMCWAASWEGNAEDTHTAGIAEAQPTFHSLRKVLIPPTVTTRGADFFKQCAAVAQ